MKRHRLQASLVAMGAVVALLVPVAKPVEADPSAKHAALSVARDITVDPKVDIRQDGYPQWNILRDDITEDQTNALNMGFTLKQNGQAFGTQAATGPFPGQGPVNGVQGHRFVNSDLDGLGTHVGRLRSNPFVVKADRISFLIGGGGFGLPTSLSLFVGGKRVRTATGDYDNTLRRKVWDVSEFQGRTAELEIVDSASVMPFGQPSFKEDPYGYVLVDDIRQGRHDAACEAQAHALCPGSWADPAYDRAHNFDFETTRPPTYEVHKTVHSHGPNSRTVDFAIRKGGTAYGHLVYDEFLSPAGANLTRVATHWSYHGSSLPGVKLDVSVNTPMAPSSTQYTLVPGLMYNGNPIGFKAHYYGEDLPEDASTIPGGYSLEDSQHVVGGWLTPKAPNDHGLRASMAMRPEKNSWQVDYKFPYSAQFGRWYNEDEDTRVTVDSRFSLSRDIFLYSADKRSLPHISNAKTGYSQVIESAWQHLYPTAPTNPPHSLGDDFALKLNTLLDPYGLMQDVTMGGRTYRIWFVGRWTLPTDFPFSNSDVVPRQYMHQYTGFSWSGMLGVAAYTSLDQYIRSKNAQALRVGTDTLDFFADNCMSPSGILFPAWYAASDPKNDSPKQCGAFGGVGQIDVGHLGDGLQWYINSYQLLKQHGVATKSKWLDITRSSLDAIMAKYPNGDVPGLIDGTTANASQRSVGTIYWNRYRDTSSVETRSATLNFAPPSEGGPTGFSLLIRPYLQYYQLTGEKKYLDYAEHLGDVLQGMMKRTGVLGGMEVDFFNVDKRMGYAALTAFSDLYGATHDPRWLEEAKVAGDYFGSWEYSYNVDFSDVPGSPMQKYGYATVGGTPVDVKASSNNTNFQQGATAWLRLYDVTGDEQWFQRARALLQQGTQVSLTEDKRKWMNANYQGPACGAQQSFNPRNNLDPHTLGGGTEDVIASWPWKGQWTSKNCSILSMYMLAEGLDARPLLDEYGGITYDLRWHKGGALDTLDRLSFAEHGDLIRVGARNMIGTSETYRLKLLGFTGSGVRIGSHFYDAAQVSNGIPLDFTAHQQREVDVRIVR